MGRRPIDAASPDVLSDSLLGVSREAHAAGLHEVAYHALCAAMHAAQSAGDPARVARIADEAREQIDWIDTHAPRHRLSTTSAKLHDHPGVYAMLGRQSEAIARMMTRLPGTGGDRVAGGG